MTMEIHVRNLCTEPQFEAGISIYNMKKAL
jgi:hypothetical protein